LALAALPLIEKSTLIEVSCFEKGFTTSTAYRPLKRSKSGLP